jgi:hypothetical protein
MRLEFPLCHENDSQCLILNAVTQIKSYHCFFLRSVNFRYTLQLIFPNQINGLINEMFPKDFVISLYSFHAPFFKLLHENNSLGIGMPFGSNLLKPNT